jgi:hypothetical protein
VVLLTNKRLFYLKRDELFGGWSVSLVLHILILSFISSIKFVIWKSQVEWSFIWEDFSSPPDLVEKGLLFRLKEVPSRKQKIPQRSSNSKEFTVLVHSAEVCTVCKIVRLIEMSLLVRFGVFRMENHFLFLLCL